MKVADMTIPQLMTEFGLTAEQALAWRVIATTPPPIDIMERAEGGSLRPVRLEPLTEISTEVSSEEQPRLIE